MQFIYDNLIASLVAAIVLFMLIGVQLATQRANVEANLHYMNRAKTRALIEMIERDFPNIGSGVEAGTEAMITSYGWTDPAYRHFEFKAVTDPSPGASPQAIRYLMMPSNSPVCEQAEVPCWRVERQVDAGSGFEAAGSSGETLTEFEIELLPFTGDLREVREVRVRLASLSPAGEEGLVGRTTWETRFHPFSLGLQSP